MLIKERCGKIKEIKERPHVSAIYMVLKAKGWSRRLLREQFCLLLLMAAAVGFNVEEVRDYMRHNDSCSHSIK